MRLDNAQSLKDIIEQWRKSMGDKDKWNEALAIEIFKASIPSRVVERVINVRIQNGVIYARLDCNTDTSLAALKQEMFYKRRFYVVNINKKIGESIISDIVFN